jgi:hypothetical protein
MGLSESTQRIPSGWVDSGAATADEQIKLTFWVKLSHTHELQDILHRVSDPDSPEYGHYLSKAQVDAITRPSDDNVAAVKAALSGFEVHTSNDNAIMWAKAPVGDAQRLLGGRFVRFCHVGLQGSDKQLCVLRNPTAQVPVALRSACDIISPVDDPFPPSEPLPGPIVSPDGTHDPDKTNMHPVSFVVSESSEEANNAKAGCCFSVGFGARMIPCCLQTKHVSNVTACLVQHRMGGNSGYSEGECPSSAAEAADLIEKSSHLVAQKDRAIVQNGSRQDGAVAQNVKVVSSRAGCCYSFGYGSMMRPCCLETKRVDNVDRCKAEQRVGGASGFTEGDCPASATEASHLFSSMGHRQTSHPTEAEAVAEGSSRSATEGCCFSFGWVDLMKPCCLQTRGASNVAACSRASRLGGTSSFTPGKCPATAAEAAQIAKRQGKLGTQAVAKAPVAQSTSSVSFTNPVVIAACAVFIISLLGGAVVTAARQRPDWRRTPFLGTDGAE